MTHLQLLLRITSSLKNIACFLKHNRVFEQGICNDTFGYYTVLKSNMKSSDIVIEQKRAIAEEDREEEGTQGSVYILGFMTMSLHANGVYLPYLYVLFSYTVHDILPNEATAWFPLSTSAF